MVILAEPKSFETNELERTAISRPFFNVPVDNLTTDAIEIHGNAMRAPGDPPAASIGLPYVEIKGVPEVDYLGLSTGIDAKKEAPVWQLSMRSGSEIYMLHGSTTQDGDAWTLVSQDFQGIRYLKGDVIEDDFHKGQISGFIRRILESAGVEDIGKKLLDKKAEAKGVHDSHVDRVQEKLDSVRGPGKAYAIDPFYGRDKRTQSMYGRYLAIGFNGLGLTCLKNMVGRDAEPRPQIDFTQLPAIVRRAIFTEKIDTRVPTSPSLAEA